MLQAVVGNGEAERELNMELFPITDGDRIMGPYRKVILGPASGACKYVRLSSLTEQRG